MAEKRAELYRVIDAMSYQPGDEKLARKFSTPHPDMDPRRYEGWMKGLEGEMNRIMMEKQEEMMPLMMPDGKKMTDQMHQKMMDAFRKKLTPGMQDGETEGSWHDSMMKMMPDMRMDPEGMKPGKPAAKMIEAMLEGWRKKYGDMPDIEPWPMTNGATPAARSAKLTP